MISASLVQLDIQPLAPAENFRRIHDFVAAEAARGAQLILFPELANTGYVEPLVPGGPMVSDVPHFGAALYEACAAPDGEEIKALVALAARHRVHLVIGLGLRDARRAADAGRLPIKLTAGGGVSSPFSPVDVTTFTEPELRAAVEAAENWGTYVAAHAFTPDAIQKAIAAGVKVIEHGMLMDEATAKLIAEKGVWLSLQPLPEALKLGFPVGSVQRTKAEQVWPGIARAYAFAKKYKIKTAWGTDVLFSQALAQQQGAILASLARWYTPAEALIMATSTNAELLELSGKRNPYPGKLGVVEQGALADLLLVDGNPLENIELVADPAKNFKIIMKDGVIYKNALN
ncbi:hypothetical protein BTHI11S_02068 [Bosea thiooxidans]